MSSVNIKMSKSDLEMEESEWELVEEVVEEEVLCASVASEDVNSSILGGKYLNNCRDEVKDDSSVKTEVKDQAEPLNEASEPIEGSDCGIIITKSEEPIDTETEIEAQTATTCVGEKQSDLQKQLEDAVHVDQDKMVRDKEQSAKKLLDGNGNTYEAAAKPDAEESPVANQHVGCSSAKAADCCGETLMKGEDDDGTPKDQAAFMKELKHFFRERGRYFKPPRFGGEQLNLLKLWRAIISLGGYDRVTGPKMWRQVGESFHPPETCLTVAWKFRIFYKKFLLEYERHKTESGELQLPIPTHAEVSGGDVEGNGYQGSELGSRRAKRDALARALRARRVGAVVLGNLTLMEKQLNCIVMNEMDLRSTVSSKQKRPTEVEHSNKASRIDMSKQMVGSVIDTDFPANWVHINVCHTEDCLNVYALVPGLSHEEVQVEVVPAGHVIISGHPKQIDIQWGVRPFKKVISIPVRLNSNRTRIEVSLHGRILIRVPFE